MAVKKFKPRHDMANYCIRIFYGNAIPSKASGTSDRDDWSFGILKLLGWYKELSIVGGTDVSC